MKTHTDKLFSHFQAHWPKYVAMYLPVSYLLIKVRSGSMLSADDLLRLPILILGTALLYLNVLIIKKRFDRRAKIQNSIEGYHGLIWLGLIAGLFNFFMSTGASFNDVFPTGWTDQIFGVHSFDTPQPLLMTLIRHCGYGALAAYALVWLLKKFR